MPRAMARITAAAANHDADIGADIRPWIIPSPVTRTRSSSNGLRLGSVAWNNGRHARRADNHGAGIDRNFRRLGLSRDISRHDDRLDLHGVFARPNNVCRLGLRHRAGDLLDVRDETNGLVVLRGVGQLSCFFTSLCDRACGVVRRGSFTRLVARSADQHQDSEPRDQIPCHRLSRVLP